MWNMQPPNYHTDKNQVEMTLVLDVTSQIKKETMNKITVIPPTFTVVVWSLSIGLAIAVFGFVFVLLQLF